MGKGAMIAVAVGIVAAVAVAGAVIMSRPASETPANINTEVSSGETPSSLRALMNFANNQHCTFSDTESASEGEVYVGNGKMRGNFETTSDSEVLNSHMISDGTNMYVWFDGAEEGFTASLSDIEAMSDSFAGSGQKTVDFDQQVDYDCNPWAVDNTVFNLPGGIEFKDFGAMMGGLGDLMMEGSSEGEVNADTKTLQCEACDSLPAEAAAQCKQVLGC